jgi:hypothetical protein
MIAHVTQSRSFPSPLRSFFLGKRSLAGLGMVVAGLIALGFGLEAQANHGVLEGVTTTPTANLAQSVTAQPTFPAPGRYLFGQVAEPDQIGQGYMVVESTGDRVYGALYYPSSSFDCFHGAVQGNQLAMTIINSYSQEAHPYSIALVSDTTVASDSLSEGLTPLSLSGFHALATLTENDLRMLSVCQATITPDP